MRVKPRALVGIGIWVLYVIIIATVTKIGGIPYPELGDSAGNLLRGVIPSLVIGALVVVGLALWMGWFGVAMRDEHRIRAWWMLIAPLLALVAALSNFAFTDWGNVTVSFIAAALVLGIAVGFAEEFVCRGVLLVGLRGSFREVVAWALSCLIFGAMHGVNILLGAPASGTLSQILSSVMAGSTFYLLRRYFGTLVPAMVLHGLFDMSIFVQAYSDGPANLLGLLDWPAGVIAVIAGLVVAIRTDRGARESYAHGAAAPVPGAA
jgi:hypothetical protein